MATDCIYVPLAVDALVVGDDSSRPAFADLAVRYEQLSADNPFCSQLSNDPFAVANGRKGVHLHWKMPDALLHGEQQPDGSLLFPDLPNRWIVQRIAASGSRPALRAWMVESDLCSLLESHTETGMDKTSLPWFRQTDRGYVPGGPNGEPFCYLGGARRLSSPRPADAWALDHLTAVGGGDPLFAACYPYCKTVFGFYDDLRDAEPGDYTYLVTGWYSNQQKDPVRSGGPEQLAAFGWRWDSSSIPARSVYHGQVSRVRWEGPDRRYPDGVPTGKLTVSLGNTSAETLAVHYSRGRDSGLERGLTALQYRLLEDLHSTDRADGLLRMENQLHARQFTSHSGGSRWILRTADQTADPLALELSSTLYEKLLDLNDQQRQLDCLGDRFASLQREAFDAWYRYVQLENDPWRQTRNEDSLEPAAAQVQETEDVLRRLRDQEQQVAAKVQELEDTYRRLGEQEQRLADRRRDLELAAANQALQLQQIPDGLYYTANQPVIQLAGDGAGCPDTGGELLCRAHVLDRLTVPWDGGVLTLSAGDLPDLCAEYDPLLPPEAASLLAEAFFTDPDLVPLLARFLLDRTGGGDTAAMEQAVRDAQKELTGTPNPPAVRTWVQPWIPRMMAWTFALTPSRTEIQQDNSFAPFVLGDLDLEPRGNLPETDPVFLSGTTLLTPHGAANLGAALQQALETVDAAGSPKDLPHVRRLAKQAAGKPFLSQQADGFDAILQMKQQLPMLPIVNCCGAPPDLVERLARLATGMEFLPVTDAFFLPVRAGTMTLRRLRLIDAFGQYRDVSVTDPPVQIAESLRADAENTALLRPRLVQPARVEFRWLSHASDEESLDRSSSPVFGFVIADAIDRGLQVYDNSGQFWGMVQWTKTGAVWRGRPGDGQAPENIPSDHLRGFVQGLLGDNNPALSELLGTLAWELQYALPDHADPFRQLCFGTVLALCRASVAIRGQGNALVSQGYDDPPCSYDTEPLPLRLGDGHREQNGLLGFYTGTDPKQMYHQFHRVRSRFGDSGKAYVVNNTQLETSLRDEPTLLTLLLDPSGVITLRTGFLPALDVTLPPVFYQKQLQAIRPAFRAAPILADPAEPRVPLPGGGADGWDFSYWDRPGVPVHGVKLQEPSPLLPTGRAHILEGYIAMQKEES